MFTVKNEVQALQGEIELLREEIATLRQDIAADQKILLDTIRAYNGQNLQVYLTRLAGMQTAEFIANNLNEVSVFKNRRQYLQYVLAQTEQLGGGYFEFGVYKGSTINIISAAKPDKIVYGFDSFEGLPESWRSGFDKEKFSVNGNLPTVNKNVQLIKGWFNETLPDFVKEHPEPCEFLNVDCDLYSSTKTIFAELKSQIVSGTVIAFDEYFNYPGWQEGEYKAFMELVAEKNLKFEYIARTNHQQCAVKII